jgi:stage V sporulation protein AC
MLRIIDGKACCVIYREAFWRIVMVGDEFKRQYGEYVEQVTPKTVLWKNMIKAFVCGGAFCVLGQFILNTCLSLGLEQQESASWCSLLLILLSVVLTGFNIYPSIANWGGAGALVPITGFANGVCAPAIEFQKEGQIFGIGCKIFTIAGPVILYGIFSSWLLGLIYWICGMI